MTELDYYHPLQTTALEWHRGLGMLALLLALARVGWRIAARREYPPPLPELKHWEKLSSRAAHWSLFALLLIVPASGYMISTSAGAGVPIVSWNGWELEFPALYPMRDAREWFEAAHWWSAYGMVGLAGLHMGAALKHHFMDKNDALRRMF